MREELRAYWRQKYHQRKERLGIPDRPPGRPPKLSPERVVMLIGELQTSSDKITEIAERYGISEGTARRYAIRHKFQRRPRKHPEGGRFRPHPNLPWYEVGENLPAIDTSIDPSVLG